MCRTEIVERKMLHMLYVSFSFICMKILTAFQIIKLILMLFRDSNNEYVSRKNVSFSLLLSIRFRVKQRYFSASEF
jgi:hypothetical protein